MRELVARLKKDSRVRQFVSSLLPTAGALAIQLVTFVLFARHLGPARLGMLSAILAVCGLAIEFVGFGCGDLAVRGTARDRANFPRYFGHALIAYVATGVPILALCVAAIRFGLAIPLGIATIAVLVSSEIMNSRLATFAEQAAYAHGEVARASLYRSLAAIVRLGAVVAVIVFFSPLTIETWAIATAIQGTLLVVLLMADIVRRYGRPQVWIARGELIDGLLFACSNVASIVQGTLDRVCLSKVAAMSLVGLYSAGSRLLQVGLFPLQIATRMVYPKFFRMGDVGAHAVRSYTFACALPMLAVAAGSAAAISLASLLIPLVLGSAFAPSANIAIALAWSLPFVALQYLAADSLSAIGKHRARTAVLLGSAVLASLLLAAGAAFGGVKGVIAAYYAGNIAMAGVLWILMLRATAPGAPGIADDVRAPLSRDRRPAAD